MNKFHILSLLCLICGVVSFAFGIISGDIETGVVVVFPFLFGSGIFAFLGFIFVFIGILLFMFGFGSISVNQDFEKMGDESFEPRKKTSVKGGGVVLIGPIPIVFGSNWKIAVLLIVLAILLIIISLFYKYL